MKLIVEAGSTNTDSVLITSDGYIADTRHSPGINPVTDPHHTKALVLLAGLYEGHDIDFIHYYGSGCINSSVNNQLAKDLQIAFRRSISIEVQDDLLAVGRGLCQRTKGIIGILGTGSNMGYYDGYAVTDGVKSCGYLLGDEGSGYRLGQAVFVRFARAQLPHYIIDMIEKTFAVSQKKSITTLYAQDNPRQYLASFAVVVKQLPQPLREEICAAVFTTFVQNMIEPMMKRYQAPVRLSGSIASHFQEELNKMLGKFDNIATSFASSPLEGLIQYHIKGKTS